jgi:hypothetical protein
VTNLTLAQAVGRIAGGEQPEISLSEFVHAFFALESDAARFALIADAPRLTGQKHLDALAGALGEYLAKHFRLPAIPQWVGESERYLDNPWHVLLFNDGRQRPLLSSDEGLREFLTYSSPAEFCSRNIFTEGAPLPLRYYRSSREEHSSK